jgi:hypothetical protein
VPREGLGFQNENKEYIGKLAQSLPCDDGKTSESHLNEYVATVNKRFDQVMEQI